MSSQPTPVETRQRGNKALKSRCLLVDRHASANRPLFRGCLPNGKRAMNHIFSPDFEERLARGKYTRWACDLNEEHLAALLWTVGECGMRQELINARLNMEMAKALRVPRGWRMR